MPDSRSSGLPLFDLRVSIENPAIATIAERLCQAVERAVGAHLMKLESPPAKKPKQQSLKPPVIVPDGVELPEEERRKAADLRTALLLGKLPEDAGILIDHRTTAKLLNVSQRTLYRLSSEGAIPEPVKIAGNIHMKRWRLAEILEWVESDCPPRKHWSYPNANLNRRKKGR